MSRGDGPVAIVVAASQNHLGAVGTLLTGSPLLLMENHKVLVFTDRFSRRDIQTFRRFEGVELKRFDESSLSRTLRRSWATKVFSPLVYAKFLAFDQHREFSSAIISDYDIWIRRPIDEVVGENPSIRAMRNPYTLSRQFRKTPPDLEEFADWPSHSAALVALNLQTTKGVLESDLLFELAHRYAVDLRLPEQAILDIAYIRAGICPVILDHNCYASHPSAPSQVDAAILHSYGAQKFWDTRELEEWNLAYRTWLSKGGRAISNRRRVRRALSRTLKRCSSSLAPYRINKP